MVSTETSTPSTGTLNKSNNKSAFYAQHIKDWEQSGLSQEKYCKSVNLSYPTFVYWRVKFLEQDKSASPKQRCLKSKTVQEKNPVFTQIKIKEPVIPKREAIRTGLSDSLILIMPNGIEIVLPIAMDDQRLVSLARSLWGAIC
jgi:hypothetical protein